MKKIFTKTVYIPIVLSGDKKVFFSVEDGSGKRKEFRKRPAVERFCRKHRCVYIEQKNTFFGW